METIYDIHLTDTKHLRKLFMWGLVPDTDDVSKLERSVSVRSRSSLEVMEVKLVKERKKIHLCRRFASLYATHNQQWL